MNGEKAGYEYSPSPKKNNHKLKELSKVYKVNIGGGDELSDKYSVVSKAARKQANIARNYGVQPRDILEYGVAGVKYNRKGYDEGY